MQVYLAHATSFDYQQELYAPLQQLSIPQVKLIFPHLQTAQPIHSKQLIAASHLILAEVTYPSTGMGIELGWAEQLVKPIYALYREGCTYSSSLKLITTAIYSYQDVQQLCAIVREICENSI